ncbi:MAG: hypothetical protein JJ871_13425 [Thalassospira sp.]|uniref:hypothetical protein n=1 Tax=Thalassospira sp. TaxID=1912094 RepID=UPI001B030FC9|nr:hypothetical protein [Thalassospira sp.]MBO6578395.1 hypothetical protein [Thalassospira sp.]MBO6818852.1 hypothetical protein [Thalassospira sp.]MBO6889055.1 hypothetical protein [Thalassospira sp.]
MGQYDYLSSSIYRWTTINNIRAESVVDRFKKLNLESDQYGVLIGDMKSRLSTMEGRSFVFMIISFMLNVFLFIGVYFPGKDISLLEVSSSDLHSVKEIALFVSCTVLVHSSILYMNTGVLAAALMKMYFPGKGVEGEKASENIVPGNLYGNENMFNVHRGNMFLASPLMFVCGLFPWIVFVFVLIYACAAVFVQSYVVWDVIKRPTVGDFFLYILVSYAVVCNFLFLFMTVFQRINLPFESYNLDFFKYISGLGGKEYDDFCVSSVTWEGRPKILDYIVFISLMDIAAIVVFLSISKIVWNGVLDIQMFCYAMVAWVVFSFVWIFIVWRKKLEIFILVNRNDLDRFDAEHYARWSLEKSNLNPD